MRTNEICKQINIYIYLFACYITLFVYEIHINHMNGNIRYIYITCIYSKYIYMFGILHVYKWLELDRQSPMEASMVLRSLKKSPPAKSSRSTGSKDLKASVSSGKSAKMCMVAMNVNI